MNTNELQHSIICSCQKPIYKCLDCMMDLCGNPQCALNSYFETFFGNHHELCKQCHTHWSCRSSPLCLTCQTNLCFVSLTFALANDQVHDFSSFDMIINLNAPWNGCLPGSSKSSENALLLGTPVENTSESCAYMAKALSMMWSWISARLTATSRIVFQCSDGNNRSVAAYLYFVFRAYRTPPSQTYSFMKSSIRPCIELNSQFMDLLGIS